MDNTESKLIYDLLKEIKEETKELVEKSAIHREESIRWQVEANSRLDRIETDLREHKEGVIQNRQAIKEDRERIKKLEEPDKVREFLRKKYMKWATAASVTLGIAAGVAKVLGVW